MKTITLLFIISIFINGVFGDEVLVMEGDSVTLHTNDADIQPAGDVTVIWTYQNTRIARINRKANKAPIYDDDVPDWSFKDRLKMNDQTGDLTITNIKTTDSGLYEVQILFESKNIQKSFNVKGVSNPESDQLKSVSVKDDDSVTLLTDVPDIKKYDEILWRFRGIHIAEFNKSASKISEDERFRGMHLDVQTGSLKIKNIRIDLSGHYEVDLTSSTSSGYTIHQSFTVTVSGVVKSVSVMKGDPLTIYTDVPDINTYDQVMLIHVWGDKLIAEVNKQNKKFTLYGRIRDRLKLNDQTGDLTITDIRTEDTGLYELKMSSRRRSIQRRFSVNVSERGLSPAAKAGISVFLLLLLLAAAGVFYYRRKIAGAMKQLVETKILEVDEGKSVDLKTEVNDIKRVDLIEWRFGETPIAQISHANNISRAYGYGLFKDKLKLNHQTGDLTISDIRWEHTGVYTLKIISGGEISDRILIVSVRDKILHVDEGKSVNLKTDLKDIQTDDVIEWRFNEILIAQINPANKIFRIYDDDYDLFRGKLELNRQTGDLTIKDIRWDHTGVYTLKIIRGRKISDKRFGVRVRVVKLEVDEGKYVNLETEGTDIKRVEKIEWRFGETLIAEINPANNIFNTYEGDLFRGKLALDNQTGYLNIKDIRREHTGDYTLKIIKDGETSELGFRVCFKGEDSGRKRGGDSVETRREDSGDTEMQTLLPNSSDLPPV